MAHAYLNQTGPTGVAIMDGQAGTLCGCLAVTACHMALSAFARSFSIQAEPIVSLRQLVVVFSGKRKSGKDFVTDILLERFVRGVATGRER